MRVYMNIGTEGTVVGRKIVILKAHACGRKHFL
jgi:hypothetical protein